MLVWMRSIERRSSEKQKYYIHTGFPVRIRLILGPSQLGYGAKVRFTINSNVLREALVDPVASLTVIVNMSSLDIDAAASS